MINRIKKENLLQYLSTNFLTENELNLKRIFKINSSKFSKGKTIYLITREFRIEDNFAFNFASKIDKNFEIILFFPQAEYEPKNIFLQRNFQQFLKNLDTTKIKYRIFFDKKNLEKFLNTYEIKLLIKDFKPTEKINIIHKNFSIYEIDGHNICPIRYLSQKQEYNASTYRRKIYNFIGEFLTEFPKINFQKTEAYSVLQEFLENKIDNYAALKNNPTENVTSNLSPYLNYGFISSQRIALEVIKSKTQKENKESFLEELVVRKELSDNFCLYAQNYKTLEGVPQWARITLSSHENDIRTHIYTLQEFENAKTHDELWNAAQIQLVREGKIHGYMRMYWAKQILLWTPTPQKAIEYAIYLNDKYAYDGESSNGYTGILWSIGGLHDRAFQERFVCGKIRSMTYNGAKSKFKILKYIQAYK